MVRNLHGEAAYDSLGSAGAHEAQWESELKQAKDGISEGCASKMGVRALMEAYTW